VLRFSASYKLSIHVNISLQLFHPLDKNLNQCLILDVRQNDLNGDQKRGSILGTVSTQMSFSFDIMQREDNCFLVHWKTEVKQTG
jgi:hypothetical protein